MFLGQLLVSRWHSFQNLLKIHVCICSSRSGSGIGCGCTRWFKDLSQVVQQLEGKGELSIFTRNSIDLSKSESNYHRDLINFEKSQKMVCTKCSSIIRIQTSIFNISQECKMFTLNIHFECISRFSPTTLVATLPQFLVVTYP